MNTRNIKLLKNNKLIMIIIGITIGIIVGYASVKLTNNKLSKFILLSYLYFKNSEDITFNNINIKAPFYYARKKNKGILTLIKYPECEASIFLHKMYLSKKIFYGEFKDSYMFDFNIIKEGEITIDDEKGYFICVAKKTDPSAYIEYLTIPSKEITLSFIGDKIYSKDFWEIVKQMQFK